MTENIQHPDKTAALHRAAFGLGLFTIFYNLAEGIVATYFGAQDETLALFGFGLDSFIEMLSGIGIAQMILRFWKYPERPKAGFELTALKITGACFYLLAAGLSVSAIINIVQGHAPQSTFWGFVIASISIVIMLILIYYKRRVGRKLHSEPLLADANCSMACVYMSLVLLASSAIYELFGVGWVDSLGAAGIVYFSVREGGESFEKAKGKAECC